MWFADLNEEVRMKPTRFDDLARSLASRCSRRRLFAFLALGGVAVGGAEGCTVLDEDPDATMPARPPTRTAPTETSTTGEGHTSPETP